MTTPGSPVWQPFDPFEGSLPESLSAPLDEQGEVGGVVAVVASGASARGDWGPRAALAIAEAWAGVGARVMLADLGLERPSLHRVAGIEGGEGITDVFMFGASIQRIARPQSGGAFFLAPAGTVSADPAAIMSDSRWQALEEGFGSASAVLILYAPEGDASLPGVLERSAGVILLGAEDSDPSELLGPASVRLLAALGPPGGLDPGAPEAHVSQEPVPAGTGPEAAREESYESPGGEAAPAEAEAEASEPPPEAPEGTRKEEDAKKPTSPRAGESPARRRPALLLLLVLLLVVAGALAAAWFGYLEIPGLEVPGAGGP